MRLLSKPFVTQSPTPGGGVMYVKAKGKSRSENEWLAATPRGIKGGSIPRFPYLSRRAKQ